VAVIPQTETLSQPQEKTTMTTENLLETTDTAQPSRPDGIPEKFWDDHTKAIRLDSLLESYLALEKKLSTMIPAPDTEEGKKRLFTALGVPETADGYTITPPGPVTLDPEVNKRLHEKGFTPEQAQLVYDLAAERLIPAIFELAHEYQADREVEKLISAFGGPEKWQEIARHLLAWGTKNVAPDVLDSLASSYDGVMMLHRMMQGQSTQGNSPSGFGASAQSATSGPLDEDSLHSMMRDPKYWRDRDPSFIKKVTEGFRTLYSA
jgi:hypothetical protein